jgi:ferredoxin
VRIEVNRNLCDGNGVCTFEAPDYFDLGDDDELVVLREEVAGGDARQVEAAVAGCPKQALSLGE